MEHQFNVDVAKVYGVDGAIIIHSVRYWIKKNEANGNHLYNDEYWTYNSIKAFTIMFPYWTARQIERIINNLVDNGALKKGTFNKTSYDRTRWYALHQTVESIYANGEMEFTKRGNRFTQTVEPIPNNVTYSDTDSNQVFSEIENFAENDGAVPMNFANKMCEIFYEENPTYPKNFKLDIRPAREIFDFLKSQGHENDKIFNLWRQIASLRADNPFYKDKPLKIISSQIQGLYEAVMKPKEKNSKTKAFVNFTKIK